MQRKSLAIATPVGSFKGAFAHGVLTALEEAGIVADAYAAASSSVIPASWAAIGRASNLGIDYWLAGLSALAQRLAPVGSPDHGAESAVLGFPRLDSPFLTGNPSKGESQVEHLSKTSQTRQPQQNMSKVVQRGIRIFSKQLRQYLYQPHNPTLYIATNAVIHTAAAAQTQTHLAQDLGKSLLRASVSKDRSWVDANLRFTLFSTHHPEDRHRITPNNFPAVAYASSRIMHAWEIPAWIDGKPYVDAAYTCLCPALAMVAAGYQETIAIANEPGTMYQDMFHIDPVPNSSRGVPIHIIRPDLPLKELGVDFTKATPDGLVAVYRHGQEKGLEFLSKWK